VNGLDAAILVVVGLSTLIAAWRGLVRSLFSLAGWVAAIVLTAILGDATAALLPANWTEPARILVGHAVVFVSVLILVGLVGHALSKMMRAVGLGGLDRLLGMLFGVARGLLIVMVFVFAAAWTPIVQQPIWQTSLLVPWVAQLLNYVAPTWHTKGRDSIDA